MGAGRLATKSVLVTGAAEGLGRAVADRFSADGVSPIILHNRSNEVAARAVADAVSRAGTVVHLWRADLGSSNGAELLASSTIEILKGTPLDILVLNASAAIILKPLADVTDDEYDTMMTSIPARTSSSYVS